MDRLAGKVALVTGAGRGIGRVLATALAAEGARVVVNDLGGDWRGDGADTSPAGEVVKEIEAAGGEASADHGNVAIAEDADAMVTAAIERWGRLDIVVNNAGILRDKMVFSMSDEEWDGVIAVHLRGHFCVTRAACRHWRAQAKSSGTGVDGRLISMSSEAGLYGNAGQANYAAAKAGIASFGITVAREMSRYGVTSNVIAPRARTRLTEQTFGPMNGDSGFDRWDPVHVAPVALFLASDAGASCSGQIFVAGGGTVQVIEHYAPAGELEVDRTLSPDDVAGLVQRVRGADAGPPAFPDMGLDVGANR